MTLGKMAERWYDAPIIKFCRTGCLTINSRMKGPKYLRMLQSEDKKMVVGPA